MRGKARLAVTTLTIAGTICNLPGCYLPSTHEKVNYVVQDFEPAYRVRKPISRKIRLYVHEFSDARGGTASNVIGEANVGFSNKPKPIILQGGVVELSTRTFREAFSNAGFSIAENEKDADLIFKGRINRFTAWESGVGTLQERSEADVELDVVFIDRLNKKNIWFDVKRSHVKSKPASMDTTLQNIEALNEAFGNVVNSILNDDGLQMALDDFIRTKEKD